MIPSLVYSLRLVPLMVARHTCKPYLWGFPGGAVVENPPANAGDTGSSPGLGRSHMLRSNCARDPQLLSLCIWSLCSATREAVTVRGPRTAMKSGPRLPQLEKALTQKQRPNTAINKEINKFIKTLPVHFLTCKQGVEVKIIMRSSSSEYEV